MGDRISSSSTEKRRQNSPGFHAAAIFLGLISAIFLFIVILYNVPLHSSFSTVTDPDRRFWLVRLTDRGIEYGLGVWGWCEWREVVQSDPLVDGRSGIVSGGSCTKHPFWKLPYQADKRDPIKDLDLPDSIAHSLSITGFFLTFVLYLALDLTFFLILALRFHSYDQPSSTAPLHFFPPKELKYRTWIAHTLRNAYMRTAATVSILVWGLPVIVAAAVGVGELDDKMNGQLGAGWGLALATIILLLLVQFLILAGGLWNKSTRSGIKH